MIPCPLRGETALPTHWIAEVNDKSKKHCIESQPNKGYVVKEKSPTKMGKRKEVEKDCAPYALSRLKPHAEFMTLALFTNLIQEPCNSILLYKPNVIEMFPHRRGKMILRYPSLATKSRNAVQVHASSAFATISID